MNKPARLKNRMPSSGCFATAGHRAVEQTMLELGELFYSGARLETQLKLRLFPLIVGPTGVGKSHLVSRIAHALAAEYIKLTRGDWLVQGCKEGQPSVFSILDSVVSRERVVLHLDELDKFQIDFRSQDWGAAIASDLWNVLDGNFPFAEYLRQRSFASGTQPTVADLRAWMKVRLWIVGSGTWQNVFAAHQPGTTLGFAPKSVGAPLVGREEIVRAQLISPELLHRFNSDLLFLRYPTKEETEALFAHYNLHKLASEAGCVLQASDVDWTQGGVRALETLATRLYLRKLLLQKESSRGPAGTVVGPD